MVEVERNLLKHRSGAARWNQIIRPALRIVGSVYVIDRPIVFDATKDRPVILSAIKTARSEIFWQSKEIALGQAVPLNEPVQGLSS
jgi:hypothetical protein